MASRATARTASTPPGIFVLFDGLSLVAKRLEKVANFDPPTLWIISDNPIYAPYERSEARSTSSGGSGGSREWRMPGRLTLVSSASCCGAIPGRASTHALT